MIGCKRARGDLSGFVDETLPEKRWQEVAQHLAGCPVCREEMIELCELRSRLSSAKERDCCAPSSLASRLEAIAGEERVQPLYLPNGESGELPSKRKQNRKLVVRGSVAALGACLAVFLLGLALAPEARILDNPIAVAREQFAMQTTAISVQESVGAVLLAQDRGAQLGSFDQADTHVPPALTALPISAESAAELLHREAAGDVALSGVQLVQVVGDNNQVLGAEVAIDRVAGEGSGLVVYDRVGERFLTSFAADFSSEDLSAPAGWTFYVYPSVSLEAGRQAIVIEARSGSLAVARWWLDNLTGVVLRSERFDSTGRPTISVSYRRLLLGTAKLPEKRKTEAVLSRATASGQRGWCVGLDRCPRELAGLPLVAYSAASTGQRSMSLVYSDGLHTLSVTWVEGRVAGAQRVEAAAAAGLPSVVSWQTRSGVVSVATNGPRKTMEAAVDGLPEQEAYNPGLWNSFLSGLGRVFGLR